MRELMHVMIEQNSLFRVGLEAAQEESTATQRTTIADVCTTSIGYSRQYCKLMEASPDILLWDQNFIGGRRVVKWNEEPAGGGLYTTRELVYIVKIQLIDIARTWMKSGEASLERLIAWKVFSNRFYVRFFPLTA